MGQWQSSTRKLNRHYQSRHKTTSAYYELEDSAQAIFGLVSTSGAPAFFAPIMREPDAIQGRPYSQASDGTITYYWGDNYYYVPFTHATPVFTGKWIRQGNLATSDNLYSYYIGVYDKTTETLINSSKKVSYSLLHEEQSDGSTYYNCILDPRKPENLNSAGRYTKLTSQSSVLCPSVADVTDVIDVTLNRYCVLYATTKYTTTSGTETALPEAYSFMYDYPEIDPDAYPLPDGDMYTKAEKALESVEGEYFPKYPTGYYPCGITFFNSYSDYNIAGIGGCDIRAGEGAYNASVHAELTQEIAYSIYAPGFPELITGQPKNSTGRYLYSLNYYKTAIVCTGGKNGSYTIPGQNIPATYILEGTTSPSYSQKFALSTDDSGVSQFFIRHVDHLDVESGFTFWDEITT